MNPGRYSFSDESLAQLCIQIQANTDKIPVRVNLRGEYQTVMLADLPAALAVFFAVDLILAHVVERPSDATYDDGADADPVAAAAVEAVHGALKLLPAWRDDE